MRRGLVMAATIGAAAVVAAPAAAAGSHASSREQHFVENEAGIELSVSNSGLATETLYKVKSGPFGLGTTIRDAVQKGTSYPLTGTDVATAFFKDGRLVASETFAESAPSTAGVGIITGKGSCTGGTFKHQHESCTYTMKGNYNLKTGITFLTLSGTYTPPSAGTGKTK